MTFRHLVLKIAKYFGLFGLALALSMLVGVMLFYQTGIPQETIRRMTQQELAKIFQQKVTVEKVSGNLITQATVHGVRFYNPKAFQPGTAIHIEDLTVHYSLADVIRFKGDVMKASPYIEIGSLKLYIQRTIEDKWNILHIFPPADPSLPPPTFKGKIFIKNIGFYFQDEKGWKQSPSVFKAAGTLSGVINCKNLKQATLLLTGHIVEAKADSGVSFWKKWFVTSQQSPMQIKGKFNVLNGQFDLNMIVANLDAKRWGNYVMPTQQWVLSKGNIALNSRIRSKPGIQNHPLPFWVDLKLQLQDVTLCVPVLNQPLTHLNSVIRIVYGHFNKAQLFPNVSSKLQNQLFSDLMAAQVIDDEGHLLRIVSANETPVPLRMKSLQSWVHQQLVSPPYFMAIEKGSGYLGGIPLNIMGLYSLKTGVVNIGITAQVFELEHLKSIVPGMSRWPIKGLASFNGYLKGPVQAIQLQGTLQSQAPQWAAIKPKNLSLDFIFQAHNIAVKRFSLQYLEGQWSGQGEVALGGVSPQVHFSVFSKNLVLQAKKPAQMALSLQGPMDQLNVAGTLTGEFARYYGQRLSNAKGQFVIQNLSHCLIQGVDISVNDGASVRVTGRLSDWKQFDLAFSGSGLTVADPDPEAGYKKQGHASVSGQFQSVITPTFWTHPFDQCVASWVLHAESVSFYGHPYERVSTKGRLNKTVLVLDEAIAQARTEQISVSGRFENKKPVQLNLFLKNVSTDQKWIQNYIPLTYKPFSGSLFMKVAAKRLNEPKTNVTPKFFPWLNQYHLEGDVELSNAQVQGQEIAHLAARGVWDGEQVDLEKASLTQGQSHIELGGTITALHALQLRLHSGSVIALKDFQVFLQNKGLSSGVIALEGSVSGSLLNPIVDLDIQAKNLQTYFLFIDSCSGHFQWKNGSLSASPLTVVHGPNEYFLKGRVYLAPILSGQPQPLSTLDLQLEASVTKVDLEDITQLLENIRKELKRRSGSEAIAQEIVPQANLQWAPAVNMFEADAPTVVFSEMTTKKSSISKFVSALNSFKQTQAPDELGLKNWIKGILTGRVYVQFVPHAAPSLQTDITIENMEMSLLNAGQFRLVIEAPNADHNSPMELTISKAQWGPKAINRFNLKGYFDSKSGLVFQSSVLETPSQQSKNLLKGRLPLAGFWDSSDKQELAASLILRKNDIGLLAAFMPALTDIQSPGELVLDLHGILNAPQISASQSQLLGTTFYFSTEATPIQSPFVLTDGQITIFNNRVSLENATFLWKGPDTLALHQSTPYTNTLVFNGYAEIKKWSLTQFNFIQLGMGITLRDTVLGIQFANLYSGLVQVQNVQLKGDYLIPLSKVQKEAWLQRVLDNKEVGPVLKGSLSVQSGNVVIPSLGKKTLKPSILFDLECNVQNEVGLVGSLLGEGLLAGIANSFRLSLSPSLSPIAIQGSFNTIAIQSALFFSEGSVTLFNRSFDLLTTDRQRLYSSNTQYQVHPNSIRFRLEANDVGLLRNVPYLSVVALSIEEPDKSSTSTVPNATKYKHILVNIEGPANKLDSFTFNRFTSLNGKDASAELQDSYSFKSNSSQTGGQNISKLLEYVAPDIYDSTQTNKNLETQRIINQLSENQVNSVFKSQLRPYERGLAKNIGVDDIKVDYNLGKSLFTGLSDSEKNVGVSVIRSLSSQLFIRVKTNLDFQRQIEANSVQVSELELTYYFLREFSLNASNVREVGSTEFKPKASLKYTYEY